MVASILGIRACCDDFDHAVAPSFPSIRPGPHRVISGTRKIDDLVADRLHELQGRRLGSRPPSRGVLLSLSTPLRRRLPYREAISRHRLLPQTVGLAAPWTCGGSSTPPPSPSRGHARRMRRRPLPIPAWPARSRSAASPGRQEAEDPDRVTRNLEFDLVVRRQVWVVPHLLDVNQSGGSTTRVLGVAY